jgi:hypothetical protein
MYRRILLVAVLTIVFVAVGVGLVRYYLAPLAEQAARKPDRADSADDDLPGSCLAELAGMDNTTLRPRNEASSPSLIAGTLRSRDGYDPISEPSRNTLRESPADRSNHPRETASDEENAPARLVDDDAARPISHAQSAEWNAPAAQPNENGTAARPSRTVTLPVSVEEPLHRATFDPAKGMDVLDLMRRLRSESDADRIQARQELLRRGFSEVDLELARQLFSPDAEARKQLAVAVPRLASVDAARWLMWLAADPQPQVRLAAITTLATTGDPTLLDRVEALARKDTDPQVQAVADQIAKQRDLSASRGGRLK